jgi:trk system potassium uptake protein TrkH
MQRGAKIHINLVVKVIGLLLVIMGLFMFTGIPFSFYFGSGDAGWLALSGSLTSLSGLGAYFVTRKADNRSIGKREGYLIVSLSWVVFSFFGAIPFWISGAIPSFTDAFFETMSGFTATGATILSDIEAMPKGLLFWRSMTHWLGGMGIIVLSLAILPLLGIGGMQLFMAESPGPTYDKLHPRIKETAKRLWGVYVLLTLIQTGLLMLGGMNLFDGLCHAFGTMATGGFSTQNDSIAGYSPYIHYVITFFMILAGTGFTLHYFVLRGMFSRVRANDEFRFYLFVLGAATLMISISLIGNGVFGTEEGFRNALFQTVAIVTTTGFVTSDYLLWPNFAWFVILLLMFTGGCAGSTAGGIKMVRHLLLFRNSLLELKRQVHPFAVIPVRLNGKPVSQNIIYNVLAFYLIFFTIFAAGVLIMSGIGLDFESSIGVVIASLGNIGPGIGMVGPVENYAAVPLAGKWVLSFLMLLGRLELFTVLILFTRAFWKH